MGKAKYTRDKQGYFSTNVFDGTYDEYGRKHYKRIRSRKSSADLEKMVQEFGALVKTGKVSRKTDTTISEYAAAWLKTKAIYTNNTQRQYSDIIRYYIAPTIGNVRLCELSKLHFQQLIAANADHPRTCQLIRRTVLQISESAVDDHLLNETVLRPLRAVQLPKYARKEPTFPAGRLISARSFCQMILTSLFCPRVLISAVAPSSVQYPYTV